MTPRTALDTGPLVALLNRRDPHHAWAVAAWNSAVAPLVTCDAVISEACWLLRGVRGGVDAALGLVVDGAVVTAFPFVAHAARVRALMSRYADVPMSFADACLVRMSELDDIAIMTLDSDFRVYRRNGRQAVPVIMPPGR